MIKRSVSLLISILLFAFFSSGTYETSGDVRTNEYIAVSIARNFDFDLKEFNTIGGNFTIQYIPQTDHTVSLYPIMTGIVASPLFILANFLGIDVFYWRFLLARIAATLIASGAVVALYYVLKNFVHEKTAYYSALFFGLGTPIWSIASRGLWQHGTTLLCMNLSIYFLTKKPVSQFFWSGLLAGFAVWARPSTAIFFLPIFIYILYETADQVKIYFLGGLTALIPLLLYSQTYIGSITTLGQLQTFIYGDIFSGLFGSLFSPAHGLFTHAPLFLFSFVIMGITFRHPKKNPFLFAISSGALLLLFFYSAWYMWWGGWNFSYRMLLEMTPTLTLLLAVGWDEYRPKASTLFKILFIICFLWTFGIELLGVYAWPCTDSPPPFASSKTYWNPSFHPLKMCTNKATFQDHGKYLWYIYSHKLKIPRQ